jgi:hypothetical protein
MKRVAFFWIALLSCDGDKAPPPTAAEYVDAICQLVTGCCVKYKRSDGGATCRRVLGEIVALNHYDGAAAAKCVAAARQAASRGDFCGDVSGGPECEGVLLPEAPRGTKQPGEPCTSISECAADIPGIASCPTFDNSAGFCQVLFNGKAGDGPCLGTTDGKYALVVRSSDPAEAKAYLCDKSVGLYCDSTTRRCASVKQLGEMCRDTTECVLAGFCDRQRMTCLPLIPVGGMCRPDQYCAEGSPCTRATATCAGRRAGESCAMDDECVSGSCKENACTPKLDFALGGMCG